MIRLNKYLATNTGISRREADELISTGKVRVNGSVVPLGAQINPQKDRVTVRGRSVNVLAKFTTVILNKPEGYVSSRNGQGRPTIYDLLPPEYRQLKSVGRLDQNSSGLLLLTNDGDLAHSLTHPGFAKVKIYEARLDKPLEPLHVQMIADFGIDLADGKSQLGLEKLDDEAVEWRVIMSEGRNRQIRRTFKALGYDVLRLHRTDFGPYRLGDLESGSTKIA
ncbi:rRNA pseudouridine synthase [Candidatus Saccharibacteria bacterium]|jgi:23S rRNA pseudouridine2605 synthase|nr:rRNA pseudouridine synthase [Candidatus Saccharibacteria bacterium]